MPSRMIVLLPLLLLLAAAMPGHAAPPETYTGTAHVASQSEADRARGVRDALGEVLATVTGNPDVLAQAGVADALGEASRLMVEYRYQEAPAGTGDGGLELVVGFDRAAVDQLLARLGLGAAMAPGSIAPAPGAAVRIAVQGVRSVADYAAVMRYLQRNNFVEAVRLREVHGDALQVELELGADLGRFLDAVRMEGNLRVDSAAPLAAGVDAALALH